MSPQSKFRSRFISLKIKIVHFGKQLSWSDFKPIEERLAISQVASSGAFLISPLLIIATAFITWLLFPRESGTDSTGLILGTLAIVYMAWALVLATRSKLLEWAFGGFDRLHVWHRWSGIASLVFLYLHTMSENQVRGGQTSFGSGAEAAGLVMASPAQTALTVLVIISILRVLPYRIWRFSHMAIFVPFAFSAWHALTAQRPVGEFELTGYWLWFWSLVGLAAFLYRVILIDSGLLDKKANITSVEVSDTDVNLKISKHDSSAWGRVTPGQFVYLRLGQLWREAHPFSVVKIEEDPKSITVMAKRVGDWTDALAFQASVGQKAMVSRPHGRLKLQNLSRGSVWVAGGSGVTPFLQSESYLRGFKTPPTLVYFYRTELEAFGIHHIRSMSEKKLLNLVEIDTSSKTGRDMGLLKSSLLKKGNVVVCGPRQLVVSVLKIARKQKTGPVNFEIYDYRSPFGPDLNPVLKSIIEFISPSRFNSKIDWLFDAPPEKAERKPNSSPAN